MKCLVNFTISFKASIVHPQMGVDFGGGPPLF